ncbi:MAG: septum site-determining protein MinD [Clostridia bacterium]|nr:septum site-determining protein MinD [Clostridia bacterium]
MARKIVFTGGKGGVGKTTVCANVAASLAKKGARVLVCDADFGLNNVDVVCGVESKAAYDVVDVIEGRCRAKQALVRHPDFPTLYILPSNRSSPERYVSPQALKVVLDGLESGFDFVFIDSPDGLEEGFHRACVCADEAIVVTTPHITALRDADKAVALLKSYALKSIVLAVNRVRGDWVLSGECLTPEEIGKLLSLPLIGVIPDEDRLAIGEFYGGGKPFGLLASNLYSNKKRLYDPTKKYQGFFGAVRRLIRKSI